MSAKILQMNKNRKKNDKPGGSVVKHLGLLMVALAIVGLVFTSFFSGLSGLDNQKKLIFGRYGNKNITFEYNNTFGRAISSAMQQNDNIFPRVTWRNVYEDIVVYTAINWQLEDNGYVPSPRAVDRKIVEEAFQTDGKFDEKTYRETSDKRKAELRTSFTEIIAIETWTDDIIAGLYRSQAHKDFLSEMRNDTRNYDYIVLPFSDYPNDDVIAYATDNANLFRSRELSRITLPDETKAQEVADLFEAERQNVTAFADLASEHSVDTYKEDGGRMDETQYHVLLEILNEENAAAVFDASTGDIAGPFNTDYGWIIFKADNDVREADIEDTETIDGIRTYIINNDAGIIEDALLTFSEEIINLAQDAESFRTSVEEQGFEPKETGALPLNYAGDRLIGSSPDNVGDGALAGTAGSDEFWSAIAELEEIGDISRPVVLNNAIGIFSLASIDNDGMKDVEEYWDDLVNSETARIMQEDFKEIILKDTELFDDRFNKTYETIYGN